MTAATATGYGCRTEGPHGPTPCGNSNGMPDGSECDCGCSAFEDCCEVYAEWSLGQQRLDALTRAKCQQAPKKMKA